MDTANYISMNSVSRCIATNALSVTSKNDRFITSVQFLKSNANGLQIKSKTVNYFPQNLDKHFTNLEVIQIIYCNLKEIHQADLRPFSKLKNFDLCNNDLEYFEEDLFLYNSELLVVWMSSNKIKNIFPTVFVSLAKLSSLNLDSNQCISSNYIQENRNSVLELISKVKQKCTSIEDLKKEKSSLYCENSLEYINFDCKFATESFNGMGPFYTCKLSSSSKVTTKNTIVHQLSGQHESSKSIADVRGFYSSESYKFQYFPLNFPELFKKLEFLRINSGRLKEIHQYHLAKFANLKVLNLDSNSIEVLEIDLFKYNPDLKRIWFEHNPLKHIEVDSIKNLNYLVDLDLNPNCHTRVENPNDMSSALKLAGEKCSYAFEMVSGVFEDRLKKLQSEFKCIEKSRILNNRARVESTSNFTYLQKNLKDAEEKLKKSLSELENKEFENSQLQLQSKQHQIQSIDLKTENNKLKKDLKSLNESYQASKSKIDIKMREDFEDNSNSRQNLSTLHNNTLDELSAEKSINNFVMFIAVPLVCLITLINIVVYVSCCIKTKNESKIEEDENEGQSEPNPTVMAPSTSHGRPNVILQRPPVLRPVPNIPKKTLINNQTYS